MLSLLARASMNRASAGCYFQGRDCLHFPSMQDIETNENEFNEDVIQNRSKESMNRVSVNRVSVDRVSMNRVSVTMPLS